MITALNDQTFAAFVENADKPVLVDLWAEWCGPCRMLSPLVDQLAEKLEGKLEVAKVNVDECPGTAFGLGVQSIPTLLLFKDGKLVDKSIGYIPAAALEAFVSKAL